MRIAGKASHCLRRTSECLRRKRQSACAIPQHRTSPEGDTPSVTLISPSPRTLSTPSHTLTPAWIGARTLTLRTDRRTHSDVFGARTLTFRVVVSVSVAHAL